MGRLKPSFNIANIERVFEEFTETINNKTLESLQYMGEEFVNKAREQISYTDRTGNLRSSIGYIILHDGKTIEANISGSQNEGIAKASRFAAEVAADYPDGYVLIGVAGMEYAAAVESKGYDVITGSAPVRNSIIDLLNAIKI